MPRGFFIPASMVKFLNELESFRFEMVHRPGSEHVVPDAVSRASHLRDPTEEEEKASQEFVHALEGFFKNKSETALSNGFHFVSAPCFRCKPATETETVSTMASGFEEDMGSTLTSSQLAEEATDLLAQVHVAGQGEATEEEPAGL